MVRVIIIILGWYDIDQTDQKLGDTYNESFEYLFDVSGNDYEVTNLRDNPTYADTVTKMKAAINGYIPSVTNFGVTGNFQMHFYHNDSVQTTYF